MKHLSENRLAANRANAARSTGPRTPDGKARAAQNARRHGLAAVTYSAFGLENRAELESLLADALDYYAPRNSQEQFAVERIALAQLAMLHASRLEAGALTSCFVSGMHNIVDTPLGRDHNSIMGRAALDQRNNQALAEGFHLATADGKAWTLLLRYQAQAERQYRRALEDLDRLRRPTDDFPNEPIPDLEPEQTKEETSEQNEPTEAPFYSDPPRLRVSASEFTPAARSGEASDRLDTPV